MDKLEKGLSSEAMPEEPADDMSMVLWLTGHIENPCEDGKGNNLRKDWLNSARELLERDTLKNPDAKKMLEDVIEKYSEK